MLPKPIRIALIAGLLAGVAMAEPLKLKPVRVSNELVNPPARAIDPALLAPAVDEAVRNAIATLFARQAAEGNGTGLIYPPHRRRTVIDHEQVVRYYSWEVVKIPVYEYTYRERLVPRKDEYGNVVGYEKKKVRAGRKQVGVRQEKRLVRDPDGEVARTERKPIYGPGGPDIIPRGWFALNGMALYVLCEAELGEHYVTTDHVSALAAAVRDYGLPDHTFDLAWLTAGFARYDSGEYDELRQRLLSKLIDGQVRDGAAAGLWGPVAIHRDLLGRYFLVEIKLRQQWSAVNKKLEALGDAADRTAQGKRLLRQKQELDDVLDDIVRGLEDCTTQGRALLKVDEHFGGETPGGVKFTLAALPYYIYNRNVADVDDTAAAAFALAVAAEHAELPQTTTRREPAGHKLVPPESTGKAIQDALARLAQVAQPHGGFGEANLMVPCKAFDRYQQLGLSGVPFRGRLPALSQPESVRSNLAGAAALAGLLQANPGNTATPITRAYGRALERAELVAEAYLAKGRPDRVGAAQRVYHDVKDDLEQILRDKGKLPVVEPRPNQREPADLPLGYRATPHDLLPYLATLLSHAHDDQPDWLDPVARRLALRLLVTQTESGQWHGDGYGVGSSSGTVAVALQNQARQLVNQLQLADGKKVQRIKKRWRAKRQQRVNSMETSYYERTPDGLFATLSAVLVLLDQLEQPPAMDEVAILPPQTAEPAEDAAEDAAEDGAADDEAEPAPPLSADDAAQLMVRPNASLAALIADVRQKLAALEAGAGEAAPTEPEE